MQQVLPTFGAISGGTIVTVSGGEQFVPSAICKCKFDDTIVPATISGNFIRCVSPTAASAGVVPFAVMLDGQHAGCAPASTNGYCSYLYFTDVVLSSIYPAAATGHSNVTVTVRGNGFLSNPSAACRFGTPGSGSEKSIAMTVQSLTVGTCEVPELQVSGVIDFALTVNG